jgi:hypothetical protein
MHFLRNSAGCLRQWVSLVLALSLLTHFLSLVTYASPTHALLAQPGNEAPLLSKAKPVDETTKKQIVEAYGKFPLSFEANAGQTNARVKFSARGNGYGLYLTAQEAVMVLRSGPRANEQNKSRGTKYFINVFAPLWPFCG